MNKSGVKVLFNFDELDKNKDGFIDETELRMALTASGVPVTPALI